MMPLITTISEKHLIGIRVKMSMQKDKTFELWHSFMTQKKHILNTVTNDMICLQVYDNSLDFKDFSIETEFEKWATIEVSNFNLVPKNMEKFTLPGGLYAVFKYVGSAIDFKDTFNYIFYSWLPLSDYILDTRPHFEVMGDKYKNNDPNSEEDIYIPICRKEVI